jgi:hypothetical protein
MGFPLGLSWEANPYFDEIAGGRMNEKFDIEKLGAFYGRLIAQAGIEPDYEAPPSVLAYISDNARALFVRQRATNGPPPEWAVSSPLLANNVYADATTVLTRSGGESSGSITCELGKNRASVLLSVGQISVQGDGTVTVRVSTLPDAQTQPGYRVEVTGDVATEIAFPDGDPQTVTYEPPGPASFAVTVPGSISRGAGTAHHSSSSRAKGGTAKPAEPVPSTGGSAD